MLTPNKFSMKYLKEQITGSIQQYKFITGINLEINVTKKKKR